MPKITAGVSKFQKDVFPTKKDLFDKLADGQEPETLFITCADSRVSPSLISQTEPGEIFVCRNAGNIIPPHGTHEEGMVASIEYAVAVLEVKHIVVCGHSGCGAMKGAMDINALDQLPHVKKWLSYSLTAVQVLKEKMSNKDLSEAEKLDLLIKENVLLQLRHLRTHPYVAAKLATGKIQLHGWVYDIKTGNVDAYDEESTSFKSFDDRYGKRISEILASKEHSHAHAETH